jgi:hypothetical protein
MWGGVVVWVCVAARQGAGRDAGQGGDSAPDAAGCLLPANAGCAAERITQPRQPVTAVPAPPHLLPGLLLRAVHELVQQLDLRAVRHSVTGCVV